MGKSAKNLLGLVIIIAGIWFLFINKEEWTLMVCKTKLNDAECYDNSYVIKGFKSSKECLLEGASKFLKEGFECGKNCRGDEYGLNVCKEICNSSGCRE